VGSGAEPDGVPNVTVTWTAGEIASVLNTTNLATVLYDIQITATQSGLDRVYLNKIEIPGTIS
jgi:hypothetical protein